MRFASAVLAMFAMLTSVSGAKAADSPDSEVERFLDQVAKESVQQEETARGILTQLQTNLARIEKDLGKLEKEIKAKVPRKKAAPRKKAPLTEEEIARAMQTFMNTPPDKSQTDKAALVEESEQIKEKIETIKNRKAAVIPSLDVFAPKVGAIGRVPAGTSLTVAQITEDGAIHVIPSKSRSQIEFDGARSKQSFQKQSGNRLIVRGVSVAGHVDKSDFVPTSVALKVTGTEAYVTVTGARATVFVLAPLAYDATKFDEEVQKRIETLKNNKSASKP